MMARQRHRRHARALAFLRTRNQASALEIGAAAVRGEPWAASPKVWKAVESIGLALAIELVNAGQAQATRSNQFRSTPPAA